MKLPFWRTDDITVHVRYFNHYNINLSLILSFFRLYLIKNPSFQSSPWLSLIPHMDVPYRHDLLKEKD